MSVIAVVPAAGRGERLGAQVPKALVEVAGEPLLVHAVHGLLSAGCVDHVVVAAPAAEVSVVVAAVERFGSQVSVVVGGAERGDSVRLALRSGLTVLPGARVVLVHDAARAFTPVEVIRSVVDAVRSGLPAVIPVLPVADTVKQIDSTGRVVATPDRAGLRLVQTPQGFDVDVLRKAYGLDSDPDGASPMSILNTDDAGLVEQSGIPVHIVAGHSHAFKVTTPFDLAVVDAMLAQKAVAAERADETVGEAR
ncbi:2-C-methyl-D-erythritol 4-phosphate cytidylyltransferase [Actinoalloteichus hymeniacidonis]|uniref:2-C-methyl-D-erythritol 4-phosphate cytidylyltransferase n=1 Tax=Actinoalloteichus hymeniacidonis TaxID=340345 RepID=A0AAC9MVH9_9PSEU|nr:2-C-methyl-D-erythritol 4-phosphate cytidylyltransferase [Actinoalloteichus hymeniacidonis]AOS61198.1 2-C-methyl-D-erythritol 4-phosphate cytidylyltransferase [Actinoalloteichus hymeniacidonis]MBB5910801.1 2-C-methyl-D-erythritol 4-phosphate cytidylyltransferase [Actinoalloteichus hymeniacidonis]